MCAKKETKGTAEEARVEEPKAEEKKGIIQRLLNKLTKR